MSFPRYTEYKDSGVEWLGKVPKHWEPWKIAHAFGEIGSGTTPPSGEDHWYEDGTVPWVTTGELRENVIVATGKRVTTTALEKFTTLRLYPAGSLVVAMYGATIGRLAILGVDATTNQACCVMAKPRQLAVKFVYYWLQGFKQIIVDLYSSGGGQPNINQDIVAGLRISAPESFEQEIIATFLDRETAKIDALVAEQEKLITLLKEKRQAVISHAVTKGLDSSVPMRDSGVEWLGKIPEHWVVTSIKRLSPVQRGASPRPIEDIKYFDDEGEYAWVRIADVSSSSGVLEETTQRLSALGASLSVKLEPGQLFISIAGTVGKPCITAIRACIHDGFVYFPRLTIEPMFLFRLFEAGNCFAGLGKMGTQLNLNTDTIGAIAIPLPPRSELEVLLKFIDQEVGKIDVLLAEVRWSIDLLQERRTALISAAVTGQIDVRRLALAT